MKEWRCKACGATFTPSQQNFSCPLCGSGNTIPKDYVPPKTPERVEVLDEPEKHCPECGTPMRCGFIVESNSPLALTTLGEGVYWSPGEGGMLGERVSLKAYACPGCGKIEFYARRLEKERAVIERAKYTCQ
jgi:predicted RNA-binding Zn-ribbon protein involved in translation (DUF1610 family)